MPRTSQWDDNDEMWEFAAEKRTGGSTFSEIHALLDVDGRKRFGLVNVPSEKVIAYNLNKRRLLGATQSNLPKSELEEHHRALAYMGSLLRYQISPPPRMGPGKSNSGDFRGFADADIYQPIAKTEIEEEIKEEWEAHEGHVREPELFSRYSYFREHMNCTLVGRKVNNALDAVRRTAAEYNAERINLLVEIEAIVNAALVGTDDLDGLARAMTLFRSIEPTEQRTTKKSAWLKKSSSAKSDVIKKFQVIREELKSSNANSDVTKKLRKLNTAQNNLKTALTPVELVRKMVRDSECELCSPKSLERAE